MILYIGGRYLYYKCIFILIDIVLLFKMFSIVLYFQSHGNFFFTFIISLLSTPRVTIFYLFLKIELSYITCFIRHQTRFVLSLVVTNTSNFYHFQDIEHFFFHYF